MESRMFFENEYMFNHYVSSHPQGDVLQTTHWGKLKSTTGWDYYPLAVVDQGQIQASALLLSRKLPIPTKRIFYSPRGPIFNSIEALQALIAAGKDLARQHGGILWKMDPPRVTGDPIWAQISPQLTKIDTGLDFAGVQPKFIMDLDITPSQDKILDNMKNKTRYNIRYAQRKGVRVVISKDRKDLEVFYPLLEETAVRDKFTIRSYEYFVNLWNYLVPPKLAQLFLVYHEGEPLGGSIAFRLGKRAWYVYGASSNSKRNLQATYALQWEMIRWAKGSGCHVYDFRGVSGDMNPENPLYGLYRFKEGFGAQIVEYVGEYDLPCSPVFYSLWKVGLPLYQRFQRK